jgi:DNA polymerase delta subunit 1
MHVTGFMPYFFVPAPRGFQESDLTPFEDYLKIHIESSWVKCELVKKRPLLVYRGEDWPLFIKITVNEPKSVPRARDKFFLRACRLLSLTRQVDTLLREGLLQLWRFVLRGSQHLRE